MIREMIAGDRARIDEMQFKLQKYFANLDQTGETLAYEGLEGAHRYMQKMIDDVAAMNGKIFVAQEGDSIVGFIQGVTIEHRKGDDAIYDLSHAPAKEGWIGLLYVEPEYRKRGIGQALLDEMKKYFESQNCDRVKLLMLANNDEARAFYAANGFLSREVEMVLSK